MCIGLAEGDSERGRHREVVIVKVQIICVLKYFLVV